MYKGIHYFNSFISENGNFTAGFSLVYRRKEILRKALSRFGFTQTAALVEMERKQYSAWTDTENTLSVSFTLAPFLSSFHPSLPHVPPLSPSLFLLQGPGFVSICLATTQMGSNSGIRINSLLRLRSPKSQPKSSLVPGTTFLASWGFSTAFLKLQSFPNPLHNFDMSKQCLYYQLLHSFNLTHLKNNLKFV